LVRPTGCSNARSAQTRHHRPPQPADQHGRSPSQARSPFSELRSSVPVYSVPPQEPIRYPYRTARCLAEQRSTRTFDNGFGVHGGELGRAVGRFCLSGSGERSNGRGAPIHTQQRLPPVPYCRTGAYRHARRGAGPNRGLAARAFRNSRHRCVAALETDLSLQSKPALLSLIALQPMRNHHGHPP